MLDLQFITDNLDAVRQNCTNRGVQVDLDELVRLGESRKKLIVEGDELRREAKEVSSGIPKEKDADQKQALIAKGKELREKVSAVEAELKEIEESLKVEQSRVPNMAHPDAPIGKTDKESTVAHTWGDIPKFDFKALDHVALADKLDLIDFEAGAKVAGSGFYYFKNEAVFLELALIQFAVQKLRNEGFTLYTTPDVARQSVLEGIGFTPRGEETQIYSIENTDLSLVATAEITLGGSKQNEILDFEELPVLMAGISHCFRTEAGAAGKASRGIYRVHQFTKVEMFAFTEADIDKSTEIHNKIVKIEEEIFQELGVPYRVVDTCTGDLGGPAYRKFDLEAWMPGRGEEGEFGEVTSASNCTDYQARRLKVRTKEAGQKGTQFVHTLNGTAVAVSRAMIAILENNQQADGSVKVPEVLQQWVGCAVIEPKS